MCGITGHWAYAGTGLGAVEFTAFNDALAHRGPDGAGVEYFAADRLWLGHRRLSILDVTERGRQPLSCPDGRYWLTFNGEIYNFLELREQLRQLGHDFRTDTDSEVILAAYAEWGEECQLRFNGMWAFAIWDARERRLFLSRDRFGVKPLFYAVRDGSFTFASELKAFLRLPWCRGTLDDDVLSAILYDVTSVESSARTLLAGVDRLQPGHCMTVAHDGSRSVVRWWDTMTNLPEMPADLEGQAAEMRRLVLDACRVRLRSDVPVATALSGGLDSGAIACTIAEIGRTGTFDRVPNDWQRAFVGWFEGTQLDERRYADEVIEYARLQAEYARIDGAAAAADIEQAVFDLEEIFSTPLVGPWAVYRAMRHAGIRVSLDGHGADELLGGYHVFVDNAVDDALASPRGWRRYRDLRVVREGLSDATRIGESGARLGRIGLSQDLLRITRDGAERLTRRWVGHCGLRNMLRRHLHHDPRARLMRRSGSALVFNRPQGLGHDASSLQRALYHWFHIGLLPTFLRCIDRASMAHGVEVRSPFLDWRLVTFGFALPDESKIGGGYTKLILRLAMRGLMPESVRLRTNKFHFSAPIAEWSRDALRPWLLDLAASCEFLESPAWNGPAARACVVKAVDGQAPISTAWPALNAHLLRQQFRAASIH
jgi:asparagine synthase (glutamine-hydrolysing)